MFGLKENLDFLGKMLMIVSVFGEIFWERC